MLVLGRRSEHEFFGGCVQQKKLRDVAISLYRYPPHSRIPRHCHDEAYVSFVLEGSYTELSGSRHSEVLETEAAVLHEPGENHSDQFHNCETLLLAVQFTPAWYQQAIATVLHLARAKRSSVEISRIARKLQLQLAYENARSNLSAMGLAHELMAELLDSDALPQSSCAIHAREIALCSFRSPVSLMTIAEELQLTPSHVARAFKARYGVTVGEFIRNARLDYAMRRLSRSDDPLAVISAESGFYDQSHFTSQFRQTMGTTPALYRRKLTRRSSPEPSQGEER